MQSPPLSVLLLGATGTAGRGTADALVDAGQKVTALLRTTPAKGTLPPAVHQSLGTPLRVSTKDVTGMDALVICLASRSGRPADAWAIDHDATVHAIDTAKQAGVRHVVLLSAICVQKPLLAFQQAKRAAEDHLMASGLTYSIVRPTAFFKSLSGQIERVRDGKRYLLFGNGDLTACTPISDRDLGRFIASCLTDPAKANAILPIGGPGPALTPRAMGEALFEMTGAPPRYRRVPVAMMDAIIGGLSLAGRMSAKAQDKADFARIGRYYATESMLVLDRDTGTYSRAATPSFGDDTLFDHYRAVLDGTTTVELGDHAAFS